MLSYLRGLPLLSTGLALGLLFAAARSEDSAKQSAAKPSVSGIVTFTTREDHQQMLRQLGITAIRPGPSGNPSAPNSANYDESKANPYPKLPDLLTCHDGEKVVTAAQWNRRRAEIVEGFEREVYGRVPKDVPRVTWTVTRTREITIGEIPAVEKQLRGQVDNTACPEIEVSISLTLVTPKAAEKPVPVLMMFGFGGFGPRPGAAPKKVVTPKSDAPQAESPKSETPKADPPKTAPPKAALPKGPFGGFGPSRGETLLKAGWGYATIVPTSYQADNGAGLTRGIIGLTNKGQPRKPDDWGALRAWAWGASHGLDYLETDKAVDAKRVGIEGVSRYGKAALVTMAFDTRFAMVLVGSSGAGGAKLHRRNFGEAVENLTGSGEYHWMAGNYLKYGAAAGKLGAKTADDLPVDSHELIALCAPRLTFISYGIPARGDANWLDQRGSFMAAVAAGPVFRLLGAKDLGRSDDYLKETMPEVGRLLGGQLAWRQHDGGHTDGPNIEHFVRWANGHFSDGAAK